MVRPNLEALQKRCDDFNSRYEVGQVVIVRRDDNTMESTVTRSKAEVLSGHSAVIWLEGISGCYALDRVTPIVRAPGHDEVSTLDEAIRWLARFEKQDEVASTTPRKIAFELAGIHSLLLGIRAGGDAGAGVFVVENTDGKFVASFSTPLLADFFVNEGNGCYRHRVSHKAPIGGNHG